MRLTMPLLPENGPGVAKVREPPIVSERSLRLWSVIDGWWARLLESADVISEGGTITEGGGQVYCGTTSVRCRAKQLPRSVATRSLRELAVVLLRHPHTRLRLLRIAHREAAVRAGGSLGVLYADITGRLGGDEAGQWIDVEVDVSAKLVHPAAERELSGSKAR